MIQRGDRIVVPARLGDLLAKDSSFESAVKKTVSDFDSWISLNKLIFFPEYTDHGPAHISSVLATCVGLMPDAAMHLLTPRDAGALIVAATLHDCAMHLSQDGFRRLVSGQTTLKLMTAFGDAAWPDLWEAYRAEVMRFSEADNVRLFGDREPVDPPALSEWDWSQKQLLLVGEFIRRHHPRLAHQIALHGFPGATSETLHVDAGIDEPTRNLVGLIARSHGMALEPCVDYLERQYFDRVQPRGIHAVFLMALLRIADYLQIDASRATEVRLRIQALRSRLSIREWQKHHAVPQLTVDRDDPETVRAIVVPEDIDSIALFLSLRDLFADIQRECDQSWAILGQCYGRLKDGPLPKSELGLAIRRVRSTLADPEFINRLRFRPEGLRFHSADAQLFALLIEPLYGTNEDVGVRELIQNALDAVRELEAYCERHHRPLSSVERPDQSADVVVDTREIERIPCLVVSDRGIGMTLQTVRDYFLRVGASYRTSVDWKREFADNQQASTVLRTGYFGVGALAAFLVGDEVRVRTRHVTEKEGIECVVRLHSDPVQVNRVDCLVGTTVTIPVREELRKRWAPQCRYHLAKPTLSIEGRSPSNLLPGPGDVVPLGWQELKAGRGMVVLWQRNGSSVSRIIHNGFMVEHGDQPLRTLWSDQLYGLRILLPPLHILDREGNAPRPYLNLARSEFLQSRFEPLKDIFVDVLRDYLAFLLARTPASRPDVSERPPSYRYLQMKLTWLNLGFERGAMAQPVVYTSYGVVPLDGWVLEELNIQTILCTEAVDAGALIADLEEGTAVLPIVEVGGETQALLYPIGGFSTPPERYVQAWRVLSLRESDGENP
jgi:molecular chaperone HtpG